MRWKTTLKFYEERMFPKDSLVDLELHFSPGKILLCGEYLVLKGAKSLGLCCRFGQSLKIKKSNNHYFHWKALDHRNALWIDFKFHRRNGKFEVYDEYGSNLINQDQLKIIFTLLEIIHDTKEQLFEDFLSFETCIDFDPSWGLGSSSTLVANLSKWSGIEAYKLLKHSFGGSGYDLAIAMANKHITYQLSESGRKVELVDFNPKFKDHIFFVHLNKKRNSRKAISSFEEICQNKDLNNAIETVSEISDNVLNNIELAEFEYLMTKHEHILSGILGESSIKDALFPDYTDGICKSLGAWGGDFMLVTGNEESMEYFRNKGYRKILTFDELIENGANS